jgi:hypothetical protein
MSKRQKENLLKKTISFLFFSDLAIELRVRIGGNFWKKGK